MTRNPKKIPNFVRVMFRLVEIPWNVLRRRNRWGLSVSNLLTDFPLFDPNSGYGYGRQTLFLREAANNSFRSLSFLSRMSGLGNADQLKRISLSSLKADSNALSLGEAFSRLGSDKSIGHNYHLAYGQLLTFLGGAPNGILEIGLGSKNPKIASNMGLKASPGASLRAFEENSIGPLFGCDIDPDSIFSTERIGCFVLDQLDRSALDKLVQEWNPELDLVIDDGLHSVTANLNSLALGLRLTHDKGVVVIEDIRSNNLDVWQFVADLMSNLGYSACLLEDFQGSFLFVVTKSGPFNWEICDV